MSVSSGRSLERYVDKIIEWSGTWPDDLRTACEMTFDRLENGSSLCWHDFENDYSSVREHAFEIKWNTLKQELKETIAALIEGVKIDRSRVFLVKELERLGYVADESRGYTVLSGAFARYAAKKSGIKVSNQKKSWFKKLFGKFQ